MNQDKEALKKFLVELYFNHLKIQNYESTLKLTYKDYKVLKSLFMPKLLYRRYFLIAITKENTHRKKIPSSQKENIKYFLRIINEKD